MQIISTISVFRPAVRPLCRCLQSMAIGQISLNLLTPIFLSVPGLGMPCPLPKIVHRMNGCIHPSFPDDYTSSSSVPRHGSTSACTKGIRYTYLTRPTCSLSIHPHVSIHLIAMRIAGTHLRKLGWPGVWLFGIGFVPWGGLPGPA
jgi:hypothetical protein